jgi:hypothetical protein
VAAEVPVSWLRILLLAVVVAGLGAYLWLYELPQAEKEAKKEKLAAVGKDAVTGVVLAYPDRTLELAKQDGKWRLVKPIDAPADQTAVEAVIAAVVDGEVQKSLDDVPQDLTPFGLATPTVTVTLTTKDGTAPPPIKVGKNTSIGARTYVRRGDEPKILLAASSLQFAVTKQAKDLREKQILAFQDDQVKKVEIVRDDGKNTTLVRKDGDAWVLDPGGLPADLTEVRSYLSSLRSARAVEFPDDAPADLAKYGLTKPRLTVRVGTGTDADAKTSALVFGGETTVNSAKQVYAKREDAAPVYAVGDWAFRSLNKTTDELRDKSVLGFDAARVHEARIERKDGGVVTLARADAGWKVEGAGDKAPNDGAITRFLDDLRELRGSEVAAEPPGDLARFGLAAPDVRIVLTDKDEQPIGTVLAAKKDGKYYVMRADGPLVFEARDYMYNRLDKKADDFLTQPAGAAPAAAAPPGGAPPLPGADAGEGGEDDGADGADDLELPAQ